MAFQVFRRCPPFTHAARLTLSRLSLPPPDIHAHNAAVIIFTAADISPPLR